MISNCFADCIEVDGWKDNPLCFWCFLMVLYLRMSRKHVFFVDVGRRDITLKRYYSASNETVKITDAAKCVQLILETIDWRQGRIWVEPSHGRDQRANWSGSLQKEKFSSASKHAGAWLFIMIICLRIIFWTFQGNRSVMSNRFIPGVSASLNMWRESSQAEAERLQTETWRSRSCPYPKIGAVFRDTDILLRSTRTNVLTQMYCYSF